MVAAHFGVSPERFEDPWSVSDEKTIAAVLVVLSAPILVVFASQRYVHRKNLRALGLAGSWAAPLGWGTLAGGAVKLGAISAAVACSPASKITPVPAPAGMYLWLPYFAWYLFALLLNSFSEELVYRAYPISALRSDERLPIGTIVGAAVLFSLMHFLIEPPDALRFFHRFFFGVATGLLFAHRGTIAPVVGLHTGWNFVALAFAGVDWRLGSFFRVLGVSPRAEVGSNVAALTVLSIGIVLLGRVSVRRI